MPVTVHAGPRGRVPGGQRDRQGDSLLSVAWAAPTPHTIAAQEHPRYFDTLGLLVTDAQSARRGLVSESNRSRVKLLKGM